MRKPQNWNQILSSFFPILISGGRIEIYQNLLGISYNYAVGLA